jgi:hypothetical protein
MEERKKEHEKQLNTNNEEKTPTFFISKKKPICFQRKWLAIKSCGLSLSSSISIEASDLIS